MGGGEREDRKERERKSGKETMRRSKKRRERVNQISVQCAKKNASTSHWLNRGTGEKKKIQERR